MASKSPHADPTLAQVFLKPELDPGNFDSLVITPASERLQVVYFWGEDCPNCEIAKEHLCALERELKDTAVDFRSVNAYEHIDLATRFWLFGIPVFLFFKRGRLIGKVTSFPTRAEFMAVLAKHA